MPLFGGDGKRAEKKNRVIELLKEYLDKYFGIASFHNSEKPMGHKAIKYELPQQDYTAMAAEPKPGE